MSQKGGVTELFNDIKVFLLSFFKKFSSKKFIKKFMGLIIICLLTVLIPISIAVCYVQFIKEEQKVTTPDISVSLFDSDGKLIATEKTQEDIIDASPLANIFYILESSKVRANKPTEFAKKPSMSFTIKYGSDSSTFKCYFEENAEESYLENSNGEFYSPDKLAYSMFLSSSYSETVYKGSMPPTLYTTAEDTVFPDTVDWTYILNDGKEKRSKNYETTKDLLTYRIAGAISFNFSRSPDICNINVKTVEGDTVFDGSLQELTSLTAEENAELLVTVNAEWKKRNELDSYGKQKYEFKIICVEPSTFELSTTEAIGGQLILITVNGVDNTDSIIYSPFTDLSDEIKNSFDASSKALTELYSYRPIFVKERNTAYAFLPIPANIPDNVFSFSLSCGISTSVLTVKLKQSTSTDVEIGDFALTKAQKAEFTRIILYLKHSTSDTLLLSEDFLFPTDYNFSLKQNYNTNINNSFKLLANNYSTDMPEGISVKSANVGVVSLIGVSPLLGNYVMVDHGMGLLTWYCGLSDVSVTEKDIVKKGDVIGRAGSSSLLCENGVNIVCSVGGILIDPNQLATKTPQN